MKSIYKQKGKKTGMKNRRGLFLTNVISKTFEKVILEKVSDEIKIQARFKMVAKKDDLPPKIIGWP